MPESRKDRFREASRRAVEGDRIMRCHRGHENPAGLWNCPECTDPILDAFRKVEVVCLCGSTRFADQHAIRRWELESRSEGTVIVLMINYLPHWWAVAQGWDGNDHFGEHAGLKEMLDELHLRKIDLAHRVEVVNPGGYIGMSTAREINYARARGKPVTFLDESLYGAGLSILTREEEKDG